MSGFSYLRSERLARLGWCLRYEVGTGRLVVGAGSWVDCRDDFFCEGAWAGAFEEGSIEQSYSFIGSGAVLRDGQLIVVAPCNTQECVYSIRKAGLVYFSNSVPFILRAADEHLDLDYVDYESDILSILDGLRRYKRELPLGGEHTLRLHYYCNVHVSPQGDLREVPKPVPQRFLTFDDYYGFLQREVRGVVDNATDPDRAHGFAPIAFLSKGYDSTACAALAYDAGCRDALAFETKKTARSDSGHDIAKALGYSTIVQKKELDYLAHDTADLFVSSGELGTSIFYAGAEAELEGRLMFSGTYGDGVWGRRPKVINDEIVRWDYPETAKKDFRLVTGFLNFSVPFLGVMRQADTCAISNAAAMTPWSVGTDYDRPIPRRILEEHGVPRGMFGGSKGGGVGSNLRFGNLSTLRRTMPPPSFERFATFYGMARRRRRWSLSRLRAIPYYIYLANILLGRRGFSLLEKLLRIDAWPRKYSCSVGAPSFLFAWGVASVQQKHYADDDVIDHLLPEPETAHPSVRDAAGPERGGGRDAASPGVASEGHSTFEGLAGEEGFEPSIP